jgi:hypothetical protein
MKTKRNLFYIVISATFPILFFVQSGYSESDTLINQPFGELFELKRSETGELMTIAAITADSQNVYLYDLADRSIAMFNIDGEYIRKIKLQSIGRGEYIGDDFAIRNNEAIFLNAVDSRLEFFDLEKGLFRKSIVYPREIPLEGNQRRYKLINRIFIDNSRIWIGNSHAVFSIDESAVLQKVSTKQVKKFFTGSLLMLYNSKDPILYRSGKIEWHKKTALIASSRHTLSGKSLVIFRDKIYNCTITDSGFTVVSTDLTEDK